MGGLSNHAAQWNQALTSRGYQITTYTALCEGSLAREQTTQEGLLVRFPIWEIIPAYPIPNLFHPAFWKSIRFLNQQEFDLVVSRTRFFSTTVLAWTYSRYRQLPWLHIEHGSDFVQLRNPVHRSLARLYDLTISRALIQRCHALIANSQASAKFIEMLTNKKVTAIIYRGVHVDTISRASPDREALRLRSAGLLAAFVGRLVSSKGVYELLEALATLRDSSLHTILIGGGPEKSRLKRSIHFLGLEKSVTIWPEQPSEKVSGVLKAADIFVSPSYTEGLPTTVIEAALCGCAIIATNVGGTSEIVTQDKSALLIPPRDVKQLYAALQVLTHQADLRHRLAITAHQGVATQFRWEQNILLYNECIRQLLTSSRRHW